MSENELWKWLTKYFQQSNKPDSSAQDKLYQLLDRFATNSHQSQVVKLLFDIMQNSITKDNLKIIVKKYLHLMNIILEKDDSTVENKKYKYAVSVEIVNHFIVILKQLLKYSMIDEILLVKIYRKKWAKRITDSAFQKINIQAIQKLNNFNLDRGFNEEYLQKITKSYQKRGFSDSDIEKYLSVQTKPRCESPQPHQEPISESSEEESASPRKKIKRQRNPSNERGYNPPDMMNSHYLPPNSFPTPTFSVHNTNNNFYPPNHSYPYMPSPNLPLEQVRYNHMIIPDYQHIQQSNQRIYKNISNPPYYPPHYPPTQPSMSPGQISTHSKVEQFKRNRLDPHQKPRQILGKLKNSQLYECKSCGVCLSTLQNYSKHSLQHFQEAQKTFQIAHSRRDHNIAKKTYLPDINEWIFNTKKVKQIEINHYVPITEMGEKYKSCKNGRSSSSRCIICQGDLKINWSDQIDAWVFEDAIRVRLQNKDNNITHFDCYQTLEQLFTKQS